MCSCKQVSYENVRQRETQPHRELLKETFLEVSSSLIVTFRSQLQVKKMQYLTRERHP